VRSVRVVYLRPSRKARTPDVGEYAYYDGGRDPLAFERDELLTEIARSIS